MSPAKQNQGYIGLRDAKSLAYFGLCHGAAQPPDLNDLFRGQEFVEEGNAPIINSVLFVEAVGRPLQINCVAVGFDSINIIYDGESVWIGDEGERNQPVDVDSLSFSASEKIDLRIADFVDAMFENFPVTSSWTNRACADSVNTSNSAEIADFVKIYELRDGDMSPFFGVHSLGPFCKKCPFYRCFLRSSRSLTSADCSRKHPFGVVARSLRCAWLI